MVMFLRRLNGTNLTDNQCKKEYKLRRLKKTLKYQGLSWNNAPRTLRPVSTHVGRYDISNGKRTAAEN